ncbi:hypothetical protein GQ42DRAFT_164422 [Ramicandelaber brevisporus]|nr:hypothetical protein GQ42DRAFT_164422 [Ramicandelaber brevisporus]
MNFSSPLSPRTSMAFMTADEIAPSFIASSAANSRNTSRNTSRNVSRRSSFTSTPAKQKVEKTPRQLAIDATFDKSFSIAAFLNNRML